MEKNKIPRILIQDDWKAKQIKFVISAQVRHVLFKSVSVNVELTSFYSKNLTTKKTHPIFFDFLIKFTRVGLGHDRFKNWLFFY